jgi:hypothetical protein
MGGAMSKRYIIFLAFISLLFIIPGCGGGGGSGIDAPAGSIITVNPSDIEIEFLSGDTIYNFAVVVTNEDEIPLNNIELFISGPFAVPRVPARYQFYRNSNGVNPVDSHFSEKTNENGVYEFSIKVFAIVEGNPSAFTDFITIQAESASASIDISLGQAAAPVP